MTSESVAGLLAEFAKEKNLRKYLGEGYQRIAGTYLKELHKIPDREWSIADLEDILRSSKAKKEKQRELLLAFYRYYEDVTGKHIETTLPDKIIIDDNNMRRIAIVKYLQNVEYRTTEIADVFMMTDRTMREEMRALEDGFQFMDTEVQIELEHEGWMYRMPLSNHPVFLNLTMDEVAAMTVGLVQSAKNNPIYRPQFESVAKKIYGGLTDYAKGRLNHLIDSQEMAEFFEDEVVKYERQITTDLLTMLKAGCPGTIQIHHEGEDRVFIDCRVVGSENYDIIIETPDGKKLKFPIADVFSCEYEMKRKYRRQ